MADDESNHMASTFSAVNVQTKANNAQSSPSIGGRQALGQNPSTSLLSSTWRLSSTKISATYFEIKQKSCRWSSVFAEYLDWWRILFSQRKSIMRILMAIYRSKPIYLRILRSVSLLEEEKNYMLERYGLIEAQVYLNQDIKLWTKVSSRSISTSTQSINQDAAASPVVLLGRVAQTSSSMPSSSPPHQMSPPSLAFPLSLSKPTLVDHRTEKDTSPKSPNSNNGNNNLVWNIRNWISDLPIIPLATLNYVLSAAQTSGVSSALPVSTSSNTSADYPGHSSSTKELLAVYWHMISICTSSFDKIIATLHPAWFEANLVRESIDWNEYHHTSQVIHQRQVSVTRRLLLWSLITITFNSFMAISGGILFAYLWLLSLSKDISS